MGIRAPYVKENTLPISASHPSLSNPSPQRFPLKSPRYLILTFQNNRSIVFIYLAVPPTYQHCGKPASPSLFRVLVLNLQGCLSYGLYNVSHNYSNIKDSPTVFS